MNIIPTTQNGECGNFESICEFLFHLLNKLTNTLKVHVIRSTIYFNK